MDGLRKIDESDDLRRAYFAKETNKWIDSCRHLALIIDEMKKKCVCNP